MKSAKYYTNPRPHVTNPQAHVIDGKPAVKGECSVCGGHAIGLVTEPWQWFKDDTLASHVAEYTDSNVMQTELTLAAQHDWKPDVTVINGHVNIGRTAAPALLTGGLSLALGASRSKSKFIVTFVRTDQWWAQKPTRGSGAPPTAAPAPPSIAGDLQRLADLRDGKLLTEEEFAQAKARLLQDS
ncbi:MAG: SHOCT domain-containing protein [Chloroflexota bacterium]|nr:SHOCT domain-containing protein [Chloroflexota bacterium]